MNIVNHSKSINFRRIGVWMSGLCAVHCIVFPIILVLLPLTESFLHFSLLTEIVVYSTILIFGGLFLLRDYNRHLKIQPMLLFFSGFVFLGLAHICASYLLHAFLMVCAGFLLAFAQLFNLRLHKMFCKH